MGKNPPLWKNKEGWIEGSGFCVFFSCVLSFNWEFSEELKLVYVYITQAVKYAFLWLKKQVDRYLYMLSNSIYLY